MATKVNTKTMLKYEDLVALAQDVTISSKGIATDAFGNELLKGVTGIYTTAPAKDLDDIVNTATTRIHGNDLELALQNGHTITVEGYFSANGKSNFKYVVEGDEEVVNILDEGFIKNRNLYNEYNLAENHGVDGRITKTTITGTAFSDTVDLSGFDANQLKDAKGNNIEKLTINVAGGNDTITGSIVNDVISGGAGENELRYNGYVAGNTPFGTDNYKLTKGEELDISLGTTPDSYGNQQEIISKVGNNIEIAVYSKEAEIEEISYEKTVVTGDETATRYQKVVTEGDTVAMKYYKEVVDENSTPEAEGDNSGKYAKVTKLYVRNAENNDWEMAADELQPAITYEDAAVVASEVFKLSKNGGEAGIVEQPENYDNEGKFNQTVKKYNRKDDNSGWNDAATTTEEDVVVAAVAQSTTYTKTVNGGALEDYVPTEGDTFADEGKFNKTTTIYNYEDVRDIAQGDLVEGLTYVNNTHVSKAVATADLSDARKDAGYTVVEGKLHHDATYRNLTAEDLKDGLIFVDQTTVKETAEGDPRAITASDIKDGLTWVSGSGIQTAAATNDDLLQTDLDAVWTLLDNKTDASRALVAGTDLTENAQKYAIEAGTGKLVLWEQTSATPEIVDAAVVATTTYKKYATINDPAGSAYVWDDAAKPTDMGSNLSGTSKIDYNSKLGTIILEGLGKNNYLADVDVDGADIFTNDIYIDGRNGGKLVGTIGDDIITLDSKKAATFTTQKGGFGANGSDTFQTEAGAPTANLTYTMSEGLMQDVVSTGFVYGDVADKQFGFNTFTASAEFNNVNATLVDESKTKYTLSLTDADLSVKAKTNNVVYAESAVANQGINVTTNTGNDVVFFGSAANDVVVSTVAEVTASPDFELTKLFNDGGVLKYEKVAAEDAKHRDVTAEDIVEGKIFVDKDHVKDAEEGAARDIVATDIKEDGGLRAKWSVAGIETKAAVAQVLEALSDDNATDAIASVKGYGWDGANITYTTYNTNKVTYNGGNDAYLGNAGKEEYAIETIDKNTLVTINDLGGNDLLNFTNKNFSDMTIFFDVDKTGKTTWNDELSIISNDVAKASNVKSLLSLLNGNGKGAVVIDNFFETIETLLDGDNNVKASAKGDGYIEDVKVAGSAAGSFDAQISSIAQNVSAWLANNGNYDSAMEVIETGNASDVQSLMQCYTAGTTFTA